MSPIWTVCVAAVTGALAGGYAGFAIASAKLRRIWGDIAVHLTGRTPPTAVNGTRTEKAAAARAESAWAAATQAAAEARATRQLAERREQERAAALAGLELLRDVSALLDVVSRDHKHYSDSEGHCPLGLAVDLSHRLDARGQDVSRYVATYGPLLPDEAYEVVALVDGALPGVGSPRFTPPAPHKGVRRDPDVLCAFRHAAIDAIDLCQRSIDELRGALYASMAESLDHQPAT